MTANRSVFDNHLQLFLNQRHRELLCCNLRGVERETLRVTPDGQISQRSHPRALGSALSHPLVTTDYSEALLEFITEPFPKIDDLLGQLGDTHRFTAANLEGGELLWPASMPCILEADRDVPIALYGKSNVGMMKTIYRRGLGHRYGRKMQAIAGVHFNFSVPDAVWCCLRTHSGSLQPLQDFKTAGYMGMVRNFRRRFWLLLYLMGASPVADASFVKGRKQDLQKLNDRDVYLPLATSLRMGDLGYQSLAQDELYVCYNSIGSYVQSLRKAIVETYQPYEDIVSNGDKDSRQQLSAAVLQIENEFYSTIRPKQTTRTGETQLRALNQRGIEYIEVRCVDINPFDPLGIDAQQLQFLELFLLACLFDDSPETSPDEYQEILRNQKRVVTRGRDPELRLDRAGSAVRLTEWGGQLLDQLAPIADIMDSIQGNRGYNQALEQMRQRLANPDLCPSARMLAEMNKSGQSFIQWSLDKAREHQNWYRQQPLSPATQKHFERLAQISIDEQARIEAAENQTLDDYIRDYFRQYQNLQPQP